MTADFQSIAAMIVVAITAVVLLKRTFMAPKGGCGGSYGCPSRPNQKTGPKTSGRP